MSKIQHQPTPETRAEVSALKSFGVNLDDISKYIGIDRKTLSKHYADEIDKAQIKANLTVAKFLFNAASGRAIEDGASYTDCLRSAMFWAKTRMEWRETTPASPISGDTEPQSLNITFSIAEPVADIRITKSTDAPA